MIVNEKQSLKATLALAKDGDTIIVEKGIYKEQNIEITKAVVLIGKDFPVFDGEEKYEIFSVKLLILVFRASMIWRALEYMA